MTNKSQRADICIYIIFMTVQIKCQLAYWKLLKLDHYQAVAY